MINELKAQIFKKKHFGLKHKFRFLQDGEVIDVGDLHFKVSGHGVFKFKTKDDLIDYLEIRTNDKDRGYWEGKVLDYLANNHDQFERGFELILIARLIDTPEETGLWSANSFGEPVTDFPMRVFVRKI